MTWLKLGEEFTDECSVLTNAAFRAHVEGLLWTMRRETGGWLSHRDLLRALELSTADAEAAVAELVGAGFWKPQGDCYLILHHMWCQPEPEVIAARKEMARERQRRNRQRKAGMSDGHA